MSPPCVDHPEDAFIFDTDRPYARPSSRAAFEQRVADSRAICAPCPLKASCLETELNRIRRGSEVPTWGMLAGTTARERRDMVRAELGYLPIRPIEHGSNAGYQAHRQRGEDACDACKAAHSVDEQDAKKRRRAMRQGAAA